MELAAKIYAGVIFPDAFASAEPHLSDLQKTMLNATPDCIKLLSIDGRLLTMNRAGCVALNVPEDAEFGMPWLPLLPDPVRQLGLEALHKAAAGHNARFPGRSQSPDGIMYWDNLLTPVVDASGQVLSILCVSRDVTATRKLEQELEFAVSREKLLSREMQHRIKNLFAVVSGLISIAEKEAAKEHSPEAATSILRQKLSALSRASDAAFADPETQKLGLHRVDLLSLVVSVLQPYGDRCKAIGGEATISRNNMTTLALFLHEQATNSVKHGALGSDQGLVSVQWKTDDQRLDLTWAESGGPTISAAPEREGFGSEMIDRLVRSAGGTVDRSWCSEGLVIELHLPNSALT